MSRDPAILQFWAPANAPPAPPGRVQDADRALDHGLLVGEILGLDMDAAQLTIDRVFRVPDDEPRLFLDDEILVLHDAFAHVRDSLAQALEDGRPLGEGGRRLLQSPHISQEADGELRVRHTRFPLKLLRLRLDELCRLLAEATARSLLVEYRADD